VDELKIVGTAEALNEGVVYTTTLKSHEFILTADEPLTSGGLDAGPSPGDYICMSLASCKAITLRMYAQRKQWDAGEIRLNVRLIRTTSTEGIAHAFVCELFFSGNLTEEQKERMLQIDKACPISKLLAKGAEVSTVLL